MKAIILCAGKGERLRPLTNEIPKPMIPINNMPVLEYLIALCRKHSIRDIAINTSYLPEKIKQYFGDGRKFGVKLRYSYEPELLGTSGALNNFRAFFDSSFFVLYGDNLTDLNLTEMMDYHKKKKGLGTLFVYKEPLVDEKTTPGVIILNEDGKIQRIIEKPTDAEIVEINKISPDKKFMNSGIYILENKILDLIPAGFSDFSKNIFPKIMETYELYGFRSDPYIREVGQMIRYKKAKEEIESGKIKLKL